MGLFASIDIMARVLCIAALLVAAAAPMDMPQFRRVGTGSGSGTTPTPTASPTPTAAPTPAVASVITQTVTFNFQASAYTGGLKTSCEQGYGKYIGIFSGSAYVSGASMSSAAS